MPKKTRAKAVKEILAKNPKQKILFITGYQRALDETDDLVDNDRFGKTIHVFAA